MQLPFWLHISLIPIQFNISLLTFHKYVSKVSLWQQWYLMLLSDQLCHPKEDPISAVNSLLMYKDSKGRGGSEHSFMAHPPNKRCWSRMERIDQKEFLSHIHVSTFDGKFFWNLLTQSSITRNNEKFFQN